MVAAEVAGFILYLIQIRNWKFAELKKGADSLIGRIGLIQFSIMGGMLVAAFSSRPKGFLAAFGILKTLADVVALLPYNPACPSEAPGWFLRLMGRIGQTKHWKTGQDVATWWRETTRVERERAENDELRIKPTQDS